MYRFNFLFIVLLVSCKSSIQSIETKSDKTSLAIAFPGAEGFGQFATGGRGGKVLFVTTLNDAGPGSLRQAIETNGARYILFKISGTIELESELKIKYGNVTIAGQTAPGDGICLKNYPLIIEADNVILRFIRIRLGDEKKQESDALSARFHKNIIIDHCSMSWSTDECVSLYGNENTTVQWCIISESLNNSVHSKGAHGYGGIWGGKKASFHHNLLAHHNSRNPRLGEVVDNNFALTDLVDLRNNVIYNWGSNSCYGGEAMNVNIVNCYYKPGPATQNPERIVAIDKKMDGPSEIKNRWGRFYINGNYVENSSHVTNDNWSFGVLSQFSSKYEQLSAQEKDILRMNNEHPIDNNVNTHTANVAFQKVLKYCGASLHYDFVDQRIINDVIKNQFTSVGSNGSKKGIIDSQNDVGGWPTLDSAGGPIDTSGDGMPDNWKVAHNLDPNIYQANGHQLDPIYDNVEIYFNEIVDEITKQQK